MKGWIYVISNQAVPKWLAIGCCEIDPEALIRQYSSSGIKLPYPFELQYALCTPYPKSLLQKVHAHLADDRVNGEHSSDWFACDLLDSIEVIRETAGNSATGEKFYGRARRLLERQAYAEVAPTPRQQVEVKRVAAQPAAPSPTTKKREPQRVELASKGGDEVESEENQPDQSKIVAVLIVIWAVLLVILVFLIAYLFGFV